MDKQLWSEARGQQVDCGYHSSQVESAGLSRPLGQPGGRGQTTTKSSLLGSPVSAWCPVCTLGPGREVSHAETMQLWLHSLLISIINWSLGVSVSSAHLPLPRQAGSRAPKQVIEQDKRNEMNAEYRQCANCYPGHLINIISLKQPPDTNMVPTEHTRQGER